MKSDKPDNGLCCKDANMFDFERCPNSDELYGFCTSRKDVCVLYEKHLLKHGTTFNFQDMWKSKKQLMQK